MKTRIRFKRAIRAVARPRVVLWLACLILLTGPPTLAYATYQITYVDNRAMIYGEVGSTSGAAARDWNRVYRPIGYSFQLWYANLPALRDGANNPFTDWRTASYARAYCQNVSGVTVSPVTCITTHP